MKKIIIASFIIVLFSSRGLAQHNLFGVGWEVNFPNNDGYVTKTSYSGGKLEYRHFIQHKNLSFGLAINWCTYEQHIPRQTFVSEDGNSALTSDFVAQVYQVPMTATLHYYFSESKMLRPYVGVGLGAQYLDQSLYYNVYISDENNWGFVARPELGIYLKPKNSHNWGIWLAANYSYATNEFGVLNNNSFQNFGLTLGAAFWQ